jgi:heme-degrading monooxygenase HmoA
VFARFTTVRGDPAKLDTAADRVDGEVRARVEAMAGNRGFAVLTDPRGGRLIGASYWEDERALRASEAELADSRVAAAQSLDGEFDMESYAVAIGSRRTIPGRGAEVRLTRTQVDPARLEEAVTLTREETLPRVKGADGLCSFQMLIDRESGRGMVITAWEDHAASTAFAPVAEQLRARAADRVGIRFEPPETWTVVRTTVQLG